MRLPTNDATEVRYIPAEFSSSRIPFSDALSPSKRASARSPVAVASSSSALRTSAGPSSTDADERKP